MLSDRINKNEGQEGGDFKGGSQGGAAPISLGDELEFRREAYSLIPLKSASWAESALAKGNGLGEF